MQIDYCWLYCIAHVLQLIFVSLKTTVNTRSVRTVFAVLRRCCPPFARARCSWKLSPPPIVSVSRMSNPSAASSRALAAACVRAPTSRRLSYTKTYGLSWRQGRAGGVVRVRGGELVCTTCKSHPTLALRTFFTPCLACDISSYTRNEQNEAMPSQNPLQL